MGRKLSLEIIETAGELKELGQVVGRDPSTLYRWFERYRKGGLASLLELGYSHGGRPAALPEGVRAALKERLRVPEGFASYGAIQRWLEEEYGLEVKYKTVHRIVRVCRAWHETGRVRVP